MMEQQTAILEQIYKEVQQRFVDIDDMAHGWEHVERVYRLALAIGEQEGADRFVVGMAALMHDLGRAASEHEGHHADLSMVEAQELMDQYSIAEETQQAILHAIVAHSFSRGVAAQTLEAKVVRDADRLDGLGAIGILRWAITGVVRRSNDTVAYHSTDPFGEAHELDDKHYMLDHFYLKLLRLEETMGTTTGRRLAQERSAFMRTYLDELRKELNALS